MSENSSEVAPQQFLPETQPVPDSKRIPASSISISRVQETDLSAVAALLHAGFPNWWWRQHEVVALRPTSDVRNARLATRLAIFMHHPDLIGLVARVDGEFAGFAGWHAPRLNNSLPACKAISDVPLSFVPCHFRRPFTDEVVPTKLGLRQDQWEETWAGVNSESFNREFAEYDATRLKIMGDRPHWFLAPIVVEEKFRGRGVGTVLMQWACECADAGIVRLPDGECQTVDLGQKDGQHRRTAMFLDAFPNARPMYQRFGFVGVQGSGSAMIRE